MRCSAAKVKVDYMVRRNGEAWPISDTYLDGAISEVATRRSSPHMENWTSQPGGAGAG
jgi:hypothetical protein